MRPKQNLNGPQGLIVAIIDQATKDFKIGGRAAKSAREYFDSDLYQHHLQVLGLPSDALPEIVREKLEMNDENFVYANLAIGGNVHEVASIHEVANHQPTQNDYEYVGLAINAAGQSGQDDSGHEYAGLAINKKPAGKMQLIHDNRGYMGKTS